MGFYSEKSVLITGGTRGLGFILASQLYRKNARVAICGRSAESLEHAKRRLETGTRKVLALCCDVSDREQVRDMIARVLHEHGRIDVLINNAGIIQVGPFSSMADDDFEKLMGASYWGPYNTIQEVLPSMRRRHSGQIANIVSIGGLVAVPHLLPYTSAKFALSGFSQGLRAELKPDGISVTTIFPGLMRTGSFLAALFKGRGEKEFAWFSLGSCLPIVSMDAERAARVILRSIALRRTFVTVGLPAKLLRMTSAMFPGLTIRLLTSVSHFLPHGTGLASDQSVAKPGVGFRPRLSESMRKATRLGDAAAKKFNNDLKAS